MSRCSLFFRSIQGYARIREEENSKVVSLFRIFSSPILGARCVLMMRVEDVNDHRSAQKMNSKRESTRGCSLFPRFGVDLIREIGTSPRRRSKKGEREKRRKKRFCDTQKRFSHQIFFLFDEISPLHKIKQH
jgi:hypothetical protein